VGERGPHTKTRTDEEETVIGVMEGRTDLPGLDPEHPVPQLQLEGRGLTTQSERCGIKATLGAPSSSPR
jgi:hypothetical protein